LNLTADEGAVDYGSLLKATEAVVATHFQSVFVIVVNTVN